MTIEIKTLNKVPDYASVLAFWSYMEWYQNRDIEFDIVMKAYKIRAMNDSIPTSFVAIKKTLPVGMVSLKMDDLWSRKDLNPWLASLFVLPEYRNRGVGEMLISSIINLAGNMKFNRIFLFLDQTEVEFLDNYYMKRGWEFYDNAVDNDGSETKIYSYTF